MPNQRISCEAFPPHDTALITHDGRFLLLHAVVDYSLHEISTILFLVMSEAEGFERGET